MRQEGHKSCYKWMMHKAARARARGVKKQQWLNPTIMKGTIGTLHTGKAEKEKKGRREGVRGREREGERERERYKRGRKRE